MSGATTAPLTPEVVVPEIEFISSGQSLTSFLRSGKKQDILEYTKHPIYPDTEDSRLRFNINALKEPVSLEEIKSRFVAWCTEPFYLSFLRTISDKSDYMFFRGSRRGNYVYKNRVMSRFRQIESQIQDIVYFNDDNKREFQTTSCFFYSLTYAHNISIYEAWQNLGKDLNNFLSKLKQHFRCKISHIRVFESQSNGYPHIHLLLFFNKQLKVKWVNSKHSSWRLFNYPEVKIIEKLWGMGHIDIKAVSNPIPEFKYISKYLLKSLNRESDKDTLTLALCWYFRKRAFSLTSDFKLPSDLIALKHNSIIDLKIYDKIKYKFLGGLVLNIKNDVSTHDRLIYDITSLPLPLFIYMQEQNML